MRSRGRVPPSTGTGTYAMSVSATTSNGTATIGPCLTGGADRRGAVVRVVGIDAAFARRSYRPGQLARLSVTARASTIDAAMYLTGGGSQGGNDVGARQMLGAPITTTTRLAVGFAESRPPRHRRASPAGGALRARSTTSACRHTVRSATRRSSSGRDGPALHG